MKFFKDEQTADLKAITPLVAVIIVMIIALWIDKVNTPETDLNKITAVVVNVDILGAANYRGVTTSNEVLSLSEEEFAEAVNRGIRVIK